jgi:hypothetical protein
MNIGFIRVHCVHIRRSSLTFFCRPRHDNGIQCNRYVRVRLALKYTPRPRAVPQICRVVVVAPCLPPSPVVSRSEVPLLNIPVSVSVPRLSVLRAPNPSFPAAAGGGASSLSLDDGGAASGACVCLFLCMSTCVCVRLHRVLDAHTHAPARSHAHIHHTTARELLLLLLLCPLLIFLFS